MSNLMEFVDFYQFRITRKIKTKKFLKRNSKKYAFKVSNICYCKKWSLDIFLVMK